MHNLQELVLSIHHCVLESKLRLPDLVAVATYTKLPNKSVSLCTVLTLRRSC